MDPAGNTPPVPPVPNPYGDAERDSEHLRLLAIFQFIFGGLTCLMSLLPIFHLIIGLAMVSGAFEPQSAQDGPPMAFMGWFFVIIAGTFIIIGMTIGALMIQTGFFLLDARNYTFCMIIAGLECLSIPFGTVLGIFTILVLNRTTVRQRFGNAGASW